MLVSEFDYALPPELIAQHPAPERTASRLLHVDVARGALADLHFSDLPRLVGKRDALVLNDTRVIKARLTGKKSTGGRVELFVERVIGARQALALIRASHPVREGGEIEVGNAKVKVLGRQEDLFHVQFDRPVPSVLERHGAVPLPPYITHAPAAEDAERYQTVYARKAGAVAAPTAGLHFDRDMLRRLEGKGAKVARLTLHVGAGTFLPVRTEEVEKHQLHKERYEIPAATFKAVEGRRVLAVGTTSLRALVAAHRRDSPRGETDLFVYPGFKFEVVDRLLTNFHLPKSTLLMLACAFGGKDLILSAYRHAVQKRYRFFSYGDAMLIDR